MNDFSSHRRSFFSATPRRTMGSGKKNKRGGAPKQKGKLQQGPPPLPPCSLSLPSNPPSPTVLKSSLAATEARKRALVAQQSAEARVKASATNAATGGGKKRRKIVEREKAARVAEKQRVVEEDDQDEEAEMVVEDAAGEAKVKVERERKRGTVPYKVGEKILLVGEGEFSSSLLTLSLGFVPGLSLVLVV